MLSLTDRASVLRALEDPELDADLRNLIGQRDSTNLFVVQGGDTAEVINAALGFAITESYDWIQDHGLWFEIAYGAIRILVENGPGTELSIHCLCLSHFWPEA